MQPPVAAAAGWTWIAEHAWLYPALEVLHLLGIALLIGNLILVDLRLWGWGRALAVDALARAALPVALAGFALAAAAGALMFASRPGELLANRAFTLKMVLLLAAGCNAAIFHARGGLARPGGATMGQTVLSLGLWLGIMICGRWIAYQ